MVIFFTKQAEVSDCITITKQWNLENLNSVLSNCIIKKIKSIPISIIEVDDKLKWIFTPYDEFLSKLQLGITLNLLLPSKTKIFKQYSEAKANSIPRINIFRFEICQ